MTYTSLQSPNTKDYNYELKRCPPLRQFDEYLR